MTSVAEPGKFYFGGCGERNEAEGVYYDKLAAALSKAAHHEYKGDELRISDLQFSADARTVNFQAADKTWECDLEAYTCKETVSPGGAKSSSLLDPDKSVAMTKPVAGYLLSPAAAEGDNADNEDADTEPGGRRSRKSPDDKWTAFVREGNVFVRPRDGAERQLSRDGTTNHSYGLIEWSPESDAIVAWRVEPGDHKEVFNIESSPTGGGRAILHRRPYAQAGDKFTRYELSLFDVATGEQTEPEVDPSNTSGNGPACIGRPTSGLPTGRWIAAISVYASSRPGRPARFATWWMNGPRRLSGPPTPRSSSFNYVNWLDQQGGDIYVSERDGWRHLYLIDARTVD